MKIAVLPEFYANFCHFLRKTTVFLSTKKAAPLPKAAIAANKYVIFVIFVLLFLIPFYYLLLITYYLLLPPSGTIRYR